MFDRRGISARAVALVLMDVAVMVAAMALSHVLRFGMWEGIELFIEHIPTISGSCLIFSTVFFAAGLYEGRVLSDRRQTLWMAFAGTLIALVIIIVVFYARYKLHFGRGILFVAALLVLGGVVALRSLYRLVVGHGFFARPTLIVGEGVDLERVVRLLRRGEGAAAYRVFGIVQPGAPGHGGFVEGIPVLGGLSQLREFVNAYDINTIVLATPLPRESTLLSRLRPLRYAGVRVMDFISLHEELDQSIPVDHINDEWLMHASMNSSRLHVRKIKRMVDVAVSLLGLLLTAPLSVLVAIAVRLDSPGPVIFRQRRSGLDGEPYTLFKFRTMRQDAEQGTGAVWAGRNDPRVTRTGRFLRTTRLDEIPQLVNVLRGDMSLVGPRPERPEFIEQLRKSIPFYEERLLVPPGITGWAQVMYPYAASIEAARFKLQFDIYYIKHASLVFDLSILLKTFKTILSGMAHSDETSSSGPADKPELKVLPSEEAGRETA